MTTGRLTMDHTAIEGQQIAERYVLGRLAPDEAERFEEHYLSCPECLDRLETAEALARGFKRAAAQDAVRLAAGWQLAVLAWLARLGRSRQAGVLVAAGLVVALFPAFFALREVRERGEELAAARAALEEERARGGGAEQAAAEAERLRGELDASRADLARERETAARAAGELAAAEAPQTNVPILFLNPERGAAPEPTLRLRLPPAPGRFVLALEIDPPHHPAYRAVLRDAGGRELWRGADLRLNEMETLSLSLPASLLAPGDYVLAVEGVPPAGAAPAETRFVFRVLS